VDIGVSISQTNKALLSYGKTEGCSVPCFVVSDAGQSVESRVISN